MAYFPFRNIGLKFVSICIAALLWLIVAGDRIVERAMRVPVEYQNLPAALEMVGDPPENIDVRLRGASGTLGRLTAAETSAVVDLRTARPGRRLFHLTSTQVRVPYGVEVVQVAPATLAIAFENSAVRIVPINPSVEGKPAAGYEIVKVTSDPPTVEVIGPESSLRRLDEAMTEPVSVANETRAVREAVTVGVADPSVRLRTPQTATVIVEVAPGSSRRTLSAVPIVVRNADPGHRARPATAFVTVEVKGPRDAIDALGPGSLHAEVDADGLAPGEHTVDVKVEAGEGVVVESITPPTVRLRVAKS